MVEVASEEDGQVEAAVAMVVEIVIEVIEIAIMTEETVIVVMVVIVTEIEVEIVTGIEVMVAVIVTGEIRLRSWVYFCCFSKFFCLNY